jgi:hypothetical protein
MKKRLLLYLFLVALFSVLVLKIIDFKLENGNSEFGMVCFELAGNLETSNTIIASWNESGLTHLASFSLGFDYLFIFTYVLFLSLWTSLLAEGFYNKFAPWFANLIIGFFVIAGMLDMIENYFLLTLLGANPTELSSIIACYCASVKFILIGLGILYNLFVIVKRLLIKI